MTTKKSTNLTTVQNATGAKLNHGSAGGSVQCVMDTVALATTDEDSSDIILMNLPIPSNAKVISLKVYIDDLDSASSFAYDVGYYAYDKFVGVTSGTATTYAQNDLIDADAFGSATTTGQSASDVGVETMYEARDKNTVNKYAWDHVGMDADPHAMFNIGLTVTSTPGTAVAGDVTVIAQYVVR